MATMEVLGSTISPPQKVNEVKDINIYQLKPCRVGQFAKGAIGSWYNFRATNVLSLGKKYHRKLKTED